MNCTERRKQSSTEDFSDRALIAALHRDNGDSLALLFERYGRLVQRIAVNILRDSGEAEDAAQEVFLEVYRNSHLYDPARGTVKVWLLQYTYHRTLRRKAALRRRASYCGEALDKAEPQRSIALPRLSRQECRWVIAAGLAHLPARQRETLELVCLHDFSLREVAARFGVPLGCARHYYYRGIARLRRWARE